MANSAVSSGIKTVKRGKLVYSTSTIRLGVKIRLGVSIMVISKPFQVRFTLSNANLMQLILIKVNSSASLS